MTTLAEHMQYLGWSNMELAKKAGIDKLTVARALRGESIWPRSARKIVQALRDALDNQKLQPGDIEGLSIEKRNQGRRLERH